MNTFAADMKTARKSMKISQTKLAGMVGVTASFISMIEAGKRQPSIQTAEEIAHTLDGHVVFGLKQDWKRRPR